MKAAQYLGPEKFEVSDIEKTPPQKGEAVVKVAYCGICGTDAHIFHGKMDGRLSIPQSIGHEMSGVIEEIEDSSSSFKKGDRVVVRPLAACGACPACSAGHSHICHNLKFMGIDTPGAFQEYWTVPAELLHKIPDNLSLKEAALIEPLAVACHDVRIGDVKQAEDVVVIGAGTIGLLVALVAKEKGANVLVSEVNEGRLRLAEELGIKTFNPSKGDLKEEVEKITKGKGADVVFEVSGSKPGTDIMTEIARTRGRIVVVAIIPEPREIDLFRFFWRELKLYGARVYEKEDFEEALQIAAGDSIALEKIISREYPLDKITDAFEEINSGADIMKTLINCGKVDE